MKARWQLVRLTRLAYNFVPNENRTLLINLLLYLYVHTDKRIKINESQKLYDLSLRLGFFNNKGKLINLKIYILYNMKYTQNTHIDCAVYQFGSLNS